MKKFLLSILSFLFALKDYLFREWIMYIPFYNIRHFFIRRTVKEVGNNCSFLMGVEFRNGKNIFIGNNTVVNKKVLLDGRGGNLIIGNNVDIAQETNIWTLEHDAHDDFHTATGKDVLIEDYVWIGSRVTILPGVKIERGAVIATGAVVTKNIPALSIAAGIPAKVIGERKSNLSYKLNYKPWFK